MNMTNVLVYAQDIGGAQNIAAVLEHLIRKQEITTKIIVHPIAKTSFDNFNLHFQTITEYGYNAPLDETQASQFLIESSCSHILCGTSSQWQDPTNSNIIKEARKLQIPCFALLDHWKGWDRFADKADNLAYVPQLLGCIDDHSVRKLEQMGIDKNQLVITGHPYLEKVYKKAKSIRTEQAHPMKKRIILISQPLVEKNFESVFSVLIESTPIVEIINRTINKFHNRDNIEIIYRPHPKERPLDVLPDGINLDTKTSWTESLQACDIVIGLDSMALIEAFFAGKICISLKMSPLGDMTDSVCPIGFSRSVAAVNQLEKVLKDAIGNTIDSFPNPDNYRTIIEGSSDRVLNTLFNFVKAQHSTQTS